MQCYQVVQRPPVHRRLARSSAQSSCLGGMLGLNGFPQVQATLALHRCYSKPLTCFKVRFLKRPQLLLPPALPYPVLGHLRSNAREKLKTHYE